MQNFAQNGSSPFINELPRRINATLFQNKPIFPILPLKRFQTYETKKGN